MYIVSALIVYNYIIDTLFLYILRTKRMHFVLYNCLAVMSSYVNICWLYCSVDVTFSKQHATGWQRQRFNCYQVVMLNRQLLHIRKGHVVEGTSTHITHPW